MHTQDAARIKKLKERLDHEIKTRIDTSGFILSDSATGLVTGLQSDETFENINRFRGMIRVHNPHNPDPDSKNRDTAGAWPGFSFVEHDKETSFRLICGENDCATLVPETRLGAVISPELRGFISVVKCPAYNSGFRKTAEAIGGHRHHKRDAQPSLKDTPEIRIRK